MPNIKDKVRGLSHFADYFSAEKDLFVIIGGIAAMFSLEPAGILPRATKDIDLVILTNPNISFADKIKRYVREGEYEIHVGVSGRSHNYRFRKPTKPEFPVQVEVFSSTVLDFELRPGQEIIPIETSAGLGSLSAILMDRDYFELVRSNGMIAEGVSVLGISALIPLKARAFLDLSERKKKGEEIDSRDIKKHRTDVLKLAAALPEARLSLPESVSLDLREFFSHPEVLNIQKSAIKDMIGIPTPIEELRAIVMQYYGL